MLRRRGTRRGKSFSDVDETLPPLLNADGQDDTGSILIIPGDAEWSYTELLSLSLCRVEEYAG
jgi:hypothetical protein